MALNTVKPPPILPQVKITNPDQTPTPFFIDWLEKQSSDLVAAVNALNVAVNALQATQTQAMAQAQANVTVATQAAQAQATADAAAGSGAQSGDATATINVVAGGAWANGPQVNLAGVVAGNLTIPNSGPSQGGGTVAGQIGDYVGNWRIQEIVGFVETTVATGTYSIQRFSVEGSIVVDLLFNLTDTSTFSVARASVGAVSYRLDLNSPSVDVNNVSVYLYVRRA